MSRRFRAALSALCLIVPASVVSCTTDSGHARVIRLSHLEEETPPAETIETDTQAVVRTTYKSRHTLPPRAYPAYFSADQAAGAQRLGGKERSAYEAFCRQATYPHTLGTWYSSQGLQKNEAHRVIICLHAQRGILLQNGCVVVDFPVCTGSPSRPTPLGSYHILEKDPNHHSNLYDNAPMFCFMRLTWDGVGMHIGPMANAPASHGCIRLPEEACRKIYAVLKLDTPVDIIP